MTSNNVSQKQHPTTSFTSSAKPSNAFPIVVDHAVGGMVKVDKQRDGAVEQHKRLGGSPAQTEGGH